MVAQQPDQDGSSGLAVIPRPTPLPATRRAANVGLPTLDELTRLKQYGEIIHRSGLCPGHIRNAEAVIVTIQYGYQLGVPEMTALQNMYIIGGKPAMMAGLMHAVIIRDHGGQAVRIKESTDKRCTLVCKRSGDDATTEISYTIEEAQAANLLGKDVWKQYPADMLFARCISRASRQVYRDSTMGMYTPEELGESIVEVSGEIIQFPSQGSGQVDTESDLERAMRALHAAGNDKSADHQVLHDLAESAYGVASLKHCTAGQLRGLEQVIVACEIPDIQMVMAYARELDACRSMDYLDEIAGRVATETLPKRAIDFLTFIGKRVQGNLDALSTQPPVDDSIQDATFVEVTDATPAFDEAAAAWRDRVEAAHTDTDLGRALVDLSNLMAEAGSDPAKWDALIALSPTENRLKQIRMEHLKSGAKTDAGNVATYNRRAAELKAKGTAGK